MSFFNTPLDIAEKMIVCSIVGICHDTCHGIDDMFCTVCARRILLTCRGFLTILHPYIWRNIYIRCGTNLAVPSYLSILHDAQSAIEFFSTKKHLSSFIRKIHVFAPFSSTVSTTTSRSYSIRDAITDLIMVLPNVHTAVFFNVVLDELPIYFGDCDHITNLKLVFCRASIKGMNAFMHHFSHLEVMKLYLPGPTLSPLYFYNTQFLREPSQAFTDYMCRPDRQPQPVINKLVLLPAVGVNALEWFNDPTAWYDPSGLTSFHIAGDADDTNVTAFLQKIGPSVRDISNISTGDARPFDLSYTPKLLTLTLDTDVINVGQTHVALLSLPTHSNVDNLTIVIRGPYFIPKIPTTIWLLPNTLKLRCPWVRSFTVVYETVWSIINEAEFTRLAWILTSVFRDVFCHAVVDFQLRQSEGLKMTLNDLSEPFSHLLRKAPTVMDQVRNLYDGHAVSVLKLSKESEEELIGAALEKYSLEEVKRTYCYSQMTRS